MAKKEPPKELSISVETDVETFRVNMFFNRFRVDQLGPHKLLRVGLVSREGTLAQYSTVLEAPTIEQGRETMLGFLATVGVVGDVLPEPWRPPMEPGQVEVCNAIHMARTGDIGEVRLYVFSVGTAIERKKRHSSQTSISANGLALLRCDLELQKHLLVTIYGEADHDRDES